MLFCAIDSGSPVNLCRCGHREYDSVEVNVGCFFTPHSLSSHGLKSHSHGLCFLYETQRSHVAITFSCYCGLRYVVIVKEPTLPYQSFLHLFLSLSLSLSLSRACFLSSSLAACLAGCQLLIYTVNILAMMAAYGLCQTEYNKQEIRFQARCLAYVRGKRKDSNYYFIVALRLYS